MRNRVEELFHEVADLPAKDRARFYAHSGIDTTTRNEVEALLSFDSPGGETIDTEIGRMAEGVLAHFGAKNTLCGPYRLGDLLGSGGMGAVHLAERVDGEVVQSVAVKLLRPGADDARLRQRFLAERQILANLSHPHIARLLDAGHREDGQPYLVMEYVEGKPIDEYTSGFSIRQKITLFLKVCAAVGYLHRNLVVHRDLKPPNILVTGDGAPKLLDFGIAKMLDLTTDSTVTSLRMLTPDYASPEQVAGSAVTTATDIYSLGGVLYKLLTGVSPHHFQGDSMAAIALVISGGRVTPPSRLAPGLKGDLETILMKALRPEPQERYATIEQLSEDLENYLESRPIRARKGDAWYRTRKFLRRYWLPVAASVLTVSSLAGGVLAANQQRAIAQRRFVQVRQLANKLFDIDAEVRRTPGTTKAREMIVSTSLEYLQRLAGEVRGDYDLALELGNAYLRVARLQGVPVTSNLGHAEEAERSLQAAEALLKLVLKARPGDRTAMLRAAQVAHDRMVLAGNRGDSAGALLLARNSAEWLGRYDCSGKMERADADAVSMTYANIGSRYTKAEQYDEAILVCRRSIEIARSAGLEPRTAAPLMTIAEAQRQKGDLDAALATIRNAVKLQQPLPGTRPTLSYLNTLIREGQILAEDDAISLGRTEDAIGPLELAMRSAENAAREDPHDASSRSYVATAGILLGDMLRAREPRRALAVYDRALSRLAEIHDDPRSRRQEIRVLAGSTYPLRRLGRTAEAKQRLDAAFALLNRLKMYPAELIPPGGEAHEALAALADVEAERGDVRRAIDIYEELQRKVDAAEPKPDTNLADAVDSSLLYAAMAALFRRAGDTDSGAAMEARRLELWKKWDVRLPANNFVRRQLEAAKGTAQ